MKQAVLKTKKIRYLDLAKRVRAQIQSGALRPGDQLPTFAAMRNSHGVSQATLERMYGILEEEGLVVREQGRGSFVALPPRKTSGVIGVLRGTQAGFQRHPYWAHLLEGVQQAAADAEREILLLHENSVIKWEKVDGVLEFLGTVATPPPLPPGMLSVMMLARDPNRPGVVADDYQGAKEAAQHLLQLGHRRIAFLSSQSSPMCRQRLAGYRDALHEAGITGKARWVRSNENLASGFRLAGRQEMDAWLQRGWRESGCTALMAQNDEVAIGVIEALRDAEIGVPQEVSVVGFDGTEISDFCTPRLTTVDVPLQEIGARSMQILLRQIETGANPSETIVLPTRLKIGDSTAPPVRKQT